ncbi:MAG: TIGR00296 family protein [Candidatus Micrarchaeota archaeon]|nr:TIGR00296 family protein [Candidatus Micrarchaeota archaeon]
MNLLTIKEGELLVKKAREAVELFLKSSIEAEPLVGGIFDKNLGIFVTILSYPDHELRGCIGFPFSSYTLGKGVVLAAKAAATEDYRFEPLAIEELKKVIFETSVLSEPKLLTVQPIQREKAIKIPGDGLIIQYGLNSGLLLPQVAVEHHFSAKEFLEAVCTKAGLPAQMYLSSSAKLYTFGAQIFLEEKPEGKIIEKKLIL